MNPGNSMEVRTNLCKEQNFTSDREPEFNGSDTLRRSSGSQVQLMIAIMRVLGLECPIVQGLLQNFPSPDLPRYFTRKSWQANPSVATILSVWLPLPALWLPQHPTSIKV